MIMEITFSNKTKLTILEDEEDYLRINFGRRKILLD